LPKIALKDNLITVKVVTKDADQGPEDHAVQDQPAPPVATKVNDVNVEKVTDVHVLRVATGKSVPHVETMTSDHLVDQERTDLLVDHVRKVTEDPLVRMGTENNDNGATGATETVAIATITGETEENGTKMMKADVPHVITTGRTDLKDRIARIVNGKVDKKVKDVTEVKDVTVKSVIMTDHLVVTDRNAQIVRNVDMIIVMVRNVVDNKVIDNKVIDHKVNDVLPAIMIDKKVIIDSRDPVVDLVRATSAISGV